MTKSIYLLFIILLSALSFELWAQDTEEEFSSRVFHKGWLVTDDRDTIRGDIKYDMESNTAQVLLVSGKQSTLSSRKILCFDFYDKTIKTYRQFYALPYRVRSNYKTPILFEVLYEGPITLLAREKIITTTDPYNQSYFTGAVHTNERLVFTYYFVDTEGKITTYHRKKPQLLSIFSTKAREVKAYIKNNNLKLDEMRDLVRITAYYNALIEESNTEP